MFFNKKIINNQEEKNGSDDTGWLNVENTETEGQLAIDVYQTEKKIIIKSTMAGVRPENLKISLHHDLLTIKGTRSADAEISEIDYLYRECYWGSFSRSIILPAEVNQKHVDANLENGILTISLQKSEAKNIEINIKN